jgi:hypothetical protein
MFGDWVIVKMFDTSAIAMKMADNAKCSAAEEMIGNEGAIARQTEKDKKGD